MQWLPFHLPDVSFLRNERDRWKGFDFEMGRCHLVTQYEKGISPTAATVPHCYNRYVYKCRRRGATGRAPNLSTSNRATGVGSYILSRAPVLFPTGRRYYLRVSTCGVRADFAGSIFRFGRCGVLSTGGVTVKIFYELWFMGGNEVLNDLYFIYYQSIQCIVNFISVWCR